MEKTYMETIAKLFNSKLTSYKIAKDTGLSTQLIDNYRTGKSKIENMALGKAELLVKYATSIQVVSVSKSQWINIVGSAKNADEAKKLLKRYVFGWSSKESALQTFKHAVLKKDQISRQVKDEKVEFGENPDEIIPWLKNITVDDLADR
ncbi:hypothetical protein ACFFH2_06915 [Enterococcus devriesei]|uniref:Uncharacterized protein n=1 Tax=Enterococcus devriesei TaxID=319970 RepID=A0A1L8SN20_9ENTE|nr:hypothetical protein [Enterococcus devriesei]OJG33375.1 hypothetical protein RV00_GL001489 [Enterococcus devriesei]